MKSGIRNLCLILTLIFVASCQQNDEIVNAPGEGSNDALEMDFSFSIRSQITSGVGYEPMDSNTRSEDEDICISNKFKVLIAKKINNNWVLEQKFDKRFDPDDDIDLRWYKLSDVADLMNFSVILRPGEYQMTIITGSKSLRWNDEQLKTGNIVQIGDADPIYACTYRIIQDGFLNAGKIGLEEEIFSGMKHFIVEKTDDLHTTSKVEDNHLKLTRKVGKLRIMLKDEVDASTISNFFEGYKQGITASLKLADGGEFCYGLDIWGNLCYRDGFPITEIPYGVLTPEVYQTGLDGSRYFTQMRTDRQMGAFFFLEAGKDYSLLISDISVSVNPGYPNFVYRDYIPPILMKQNYINSIAFKAGTREWKEKNEYGNDVMRIDMRLITDPDGTTPLNVTSVFPLNHEYSTIN